MPEDTRPSDDIADALGDLAEGTPRERAPETVEEPEFTDDTPDHDDDAFDMDASASPSPRPRRRSGAVTRTRGNRAPTQLARHGVKACMVIGMLLLIPALWAVGILVGLPVPMAGRSSATAMALLMLLCWPIAGALIWGAFHFAKQHAKYDAQQADA